MKVFNFLLRRNLLQVKIKKLDPTAVIPKYAKPGDAGLDLTAVSLEKDRDSGTLCYGTGLAVAIPAGYVGLVFPRSSIHKKSVRLANAVGVIDSGYRGEIKLMMKGYHMPDKMYEVGDRVGQLIIMPFPQIQFVETDQLSDTQRGSGGFGSSGL